MSTPWWAWWLSGFWVGVAVHGMVFLAVHFVVARLRREAKGGTR